MAEAVVGTTFYVSTDLPATEDQAGYEAITTWQKVGRVTDWPPSGTTISEVNTTEIESGLVDAAHGSTDYGSGTVTANYEAADPGQLVIKSGVEGATKGKLHSIKVISPSVAETAYMKAKFFSYTDGGSNADSTYQLTANIRYLSPKVRVAIV